MAKLFKTLGLAAGVAAAAALVATTADAHAIWFAQRSKQLAFIYGVGADDLDSVKRLPLVKGVAGYDAEYKPVPTRLRVAGPMVMVDSDSPVTVVTGVMDNGVWAKMPDGEWVKKGKDEAPNAVITTKNMKYAVFLTGPLTAPLPAFPDQVVQIIPVGKIPEKMGEPLTVKVLYQGKPIAGARVIADLVNDPDATKIVTGADGLATIKVRNQGINVVNAIYDGPPDDPVKAAKMEHESTLTFVLQHAPE
jgi:nickel transport protein